MSSYTTPAFVAHGGFGPQTRKHPALRFFEAVVAWFDQPDHSDMADYWDQALSVKTPHGDHLDDGLESYMRATEDFYKGPFSKYQHVMRTMIVLDSDVGYDIYTQAELFVRLSGQAIPGETTVKDPSNSEWDAAIPVSYHHELVKVPGAPHEGLKVQHVTFFKDTGVVSAQIQARGAKGAPV